VGVFYGDIGDREYLAAVASNTVEAFNMALFVEAISTATNVVDVGAHLGRYSLVAGARLVNIPGGCVWAFEPNPVSYRLLEKNRHVNRLDKHIMTSRYALSDRSGSALFHLSPGDRSTSSLFKGGDHDDEVTVRTARLDDVLPVGTQIDVVKMDVEGGEVRALRGMPRVLSTLRHLFIECNPSALEAAGSSASELLSLLDSRFDVQVVDEPTQALRPLVDRDTREGYVNLYARQRLTRLGQGTGSL